LTPEAVRFAIPEEEVEEAARLTGPFDIIGQPRAVRALELAVALRAKGYNVFATGMPGTGKRSTITKLLKALPFEKERLRDIAFVHNFLQPDQPVALYFGPGEARGFREQLRRLVELLQEESSVLFEQKPFKEARDKLMVETEERENKKLAEFDKRLEDEGFAIVQVNDEEEQEHTDIAPVVDGEATSFDDLQRRVNTGELHAADWSRIREKYYHFMDELDRIFQELRMGRMEVEKKLYELQLETMEPVVQKALEQIRNAFPEEKTDEWLNQLEDDILGNLDLFMPADEESSEEAEKQLERYGVNIVVDHTNTTENPLIVESHPDYQKLFGAQEYRGEQDTRLGYQTLRAGSLIHASGGYLVLRAEDVLSQEDAWNGLRRALQDGCTEIRNTPSPFTPPGQAVKPEPVAIDVKVIIMGSEHIYDFLYMQDEEFGKLFKVPAEFDSVMDRTPETTRQYIAFMEMICGEEKLLSLTTDGKAAVLEYGVRLSEFRGKLSTRFSMVADLIRESNHWAKKDKKEAIDRAAVERAQLERQHLYNLPEEKFDEQVTSGEMILSVQGRRVGCINGLSVLDRGYYAFGRPMLITARVAPGNDGIINIERESGLSGEIHDKGMYILQGFLQATYAHDFPLSINASIAFEQSYVEVDGDSASAGEAMALLSAIGEIPVRQDIAMTGSVNQLGQMQPVGGISEKIEGFYATCKISGLTGEQGVIIPRSNVQNLILSREVQDAVDAGTFHIYVAESIDEGLHILTGMKAEQVMRRIGKRLREMAQQVKEFN
ncbi:MAG: AAA family ATPase, partial [Spirochaetaceae bacterium]